MTGPEGLGIAVAALGFVIAFVNFLTTRKEFDALVERVRRIEDEQRQTARDNTRTAADISAALTLMKMKSHEKDD
jgi:hypothetical protein